MKRFIRKLARFLPDKMYISLMYFKHFKRFPNLKNPQTFNEKLQWLKLYDRKPEYTTMVDKYLVKQYIADIIGKEYVIPTIGVWKSAEQIDFDSLPEQFVLKCNHDGGGKSVIICRNKSTFDRQDAIDKLSKCLNDNGYWYGREWPYKNVKALIIAEQYMEDSLTKELRDYKIYCFNGQAKIVMVASNRFSSKQTTFDYFDENGIWLDVEWGNPRSSKKPGKPPMFEKTIMIAEKLSSDFTHVRVDLYVANNQLYFGELTFFDGSGFVPFVNPEHDFLFGSWIKLPFKKNRI